MMQMASMREVTSHHRHYSANHGIIQTDTRHLQVIQLLHGGTVHIIIVMCARGLMLDIIIHSDLMLTIHL